MNSETWFFYALLVVPSILGFIIIEINARKAIRREEILARLREYINL